MTTAPKLIREQLLALLNKHRTHVQNSPGVGSELQRYAIAVIDDIDMDLRSLAAEPVGGEVYQYRSQSIANGWSAWVECDKSQYDQLRESIAVEDGITQIRIISVDQPGSAEGESLQCPECLITSSAYRTKIDAKYSKLRATDDGKGEAAHLKWMESLEQPKADGVIQTAQEFAEQWRTCLDGDGHDVIANRNTVARFIRLIDELCIDRLSAAPQPEQPQKPFAAPGLWFPLDILGNPMREFSPGKWECATWPSEQPEQPARDGVEQVCPLCEHVVSTTVEANVRRCDECKAALSVEYQPPQQADGGAVAQIELNGFSMSGLIYTEYGRSLNLPDGTKLYAAHPPKSPGFGVDDAMVERACLAMWPTWARPPLRTDEDRERMRRVLLAALGGGGAG